MNFKAAAAIGLFFIQKGGSKAVSDLRTVLSAVMAVKSGKAHIDSLAEPAVLDAIEEVLGILASAAGDSTVEANVAALIASI